MLCFLRDAKLDPRGSIAAIGINRDNVSRETEMEFHWQPDSCSSLVTSRLLIALCKQHNTCQRDSTAGNGSGRDS